jgi:hypothetical protein
VDWLYAVPVGAGGSVQNDQEDYLLGKKRAEKVLQSVALANEPTERFALDTVALSNPNANNQRDIMNKIREDPLFMIRKREQDSLNGIISNPLEVQKIKV